HSLLVLLCDLGSRGSYEAVTSNLDWFMDEVGPGSTAEWVSLFGTQELIDPLRDWLEEDPALVGQGVLLLAAIHNVRITEEAQINKLSYVHHGVAVIEFRQDEPDRGISISWTLTSVD